MQRAVLAAVPVFDERKARTARHWYGRQSCWKPMQRVPGVRTSATKCEKRMHFEIRQGDETLGVEIADPRLVGRFRGPTAKTAPPPDALVKAALESPVDDAPELRRAVVPGDRVTIALDSSLPSLEKIVAPIIE